MAVRWIHHKNVLVDKRKCLPESFEKCGMFKENKNKAPWVRPKLHFLNVENRYSKFFFIRTCKAMNTMPKVVTDSDNL